MTKPKWLTKEVKKVLWVQGLVLLAILIVVITMMVITENRRHSYVYNSASSFKQNLEAEGLKVSDIRTECKKGSKGLSTSSWHRCTMHLDYGPEDMSRADADKIIEIGNKAAKNMTGFKKYDSFDSMDPIADHGCAFVSCGIALYEVNTETRCSFNYNASPEKNDVYRFSLNLVCDDDSWFNKTFRN